MAGTKVAQWAEIAALVGFSARLDMSKSKVIDPGTLAGTSSKGKHEGGRHGSRPSDLWAKPKLGGTEVTPPPGQPAGKTPLVR